MFALDIFLLSILFLHASGISTAINDKERGEKEREILNSK